ncbi:MAG: hypothetical protein JWM75_567 [Sphingomonas bacterium]|nr:hypothetical protein [Sphingomonas bacterium]
MSLIAERLSRRLPLTSREADFLLRLESATCIVRRHQLIGREGEPASFGYVLQSGWVATYTDLPDGSRQMRRVHLPGDIVAMPSLALHQYAENIFALTDVAVARFPKRAMKEMFEELPRLATIMFIISQMERITLGDRLSCIGGMQSEARLAFLILDLLYRLRLVDPSVMSSFAMHLTREEMANFAGMTPVHASRKWSQLQRSGLIASDGERVTVLDEEGLLALSGYINRAADIDFSWLPAVSDSRAGEQGAV